MTNSTANRELTMTRTFRAPRELLLEMFSTPEMLTNWWGPHNFSIQTDHMDFRPGGSWKFTMIGPDGTRFPNLVEYMETGPDRIAWNHSDQKGGVNFQVIASLDEKEPGQTTMEWRMTFQSAAQKQELEEKFGAREGLIDTLTRLDTTLADEQVKSDPFRLHLSLPSDTEIRMVRCFRAPRALVFDAITKAEHIRRWQSPYKYEFADCEIDARVGGKWHMTQVGPDGVSYGFRGEIFEFIAPEKLVATFEFMGSPPSIQTNTMVLDETEGITRLTVTSSFNSKEERDAMRDTGMEWGAGQAYDRLETLTLFAQNDRNNPRFTISRRLNAPRDLVWKAWTEADRLAKWWGPKGCHLRVAHLDVQPGGRFLFSMGSEERGTLWGQFNYRDVNPIDELTFVNSFSNEQGGLTRAPFSDNWPLRVLNVLKLSDEHGGTRIHLEATPISSSNAELKQFVEWFDSMDQGFGGTFDQLEAYLASGR